MNHNLPLKVVEVKEEGKYIFWPKDLPKDAYTLVYYHSSLNFNKGYQVLEKDLLYEAWAFDGKKSWHLWKRENKWICTIYDTTMDGDDDGIIKEQLLMNHFQRTLEKNKLLIYERVAHDSDGQAYIAYACPINLK